MKEFLSEKKIEFTNKDISADAKAREELAEKYGRMATPAVVIGGKMFLGFRQNRVAIEKALAGLSGENHG